MATSTTAARPGALFTLGRALLRPALWLRFRPLVSGRTHIPAMGPVLFASNHLAGLDTILIPACSPRKVQFLAKSSLFASRVGRWFFTQVGAVPVHRRGGADAQAALRSGLQVLLAGGAFAVFPEGSRSRDGRLYRGRSGAAWIALESGATVIPVGLTGTRRSLGDRETGKPARVRVQFGAPVPLDDLAGLPSGVARRVATDRIMTAIQHLTRQTLADEFAETTD